MMHDYVIINKDANNAAPKVTLPVKHRQDVQNTMGRILPLKSTVQLFQSSKEVGSYISLNQNLNEFVRQDTVLGNLLTQQLRNQKPDSVKVNAETQ